MLETPRITTAEAMPAAVIHVTVPRSQIKDVMGPAIGELLAAVKAQNIAVAGPVFAHYLSMPSDTFDFEIGVPVAKAVRPAARMKPGTLPGGRVARTVYQGGYEGLGAAWGEFQGWIKTEGHAIAQGLWEVYAKGPDKDPDPASWRTELNQPLQD